MSETQNATPAETLEQRIMDPCVPKSETEWWAHREIERQRAEIERLRAALRDIDALNPDVPDALGANDLRVIVAQMGDLAVKALEGKQ